MNTKMTRKFRITNWLLEIILLILIIIFSISANNFLTVGNIFNILRSISFKGIIACFMTMTIISGEIVQIAIPNGHLCHIRRPLCDLIGGQPGTH